MWAAALMAVFYAVCLLAPIAAFAFGEAEAHCLTDNNHGLGTVHVHDDGSVHRHATEPPSADVPGDEASRQATGKCCGLVCLAAMLPATQDALVPARPFLIFPVAEDALLGDVATRLFRPPAPAI